MMRSFSLIGRLLLIARLAFGAMFVFSAYEKILEPDKFAQQVANYEILRPASSAIVGALLPWSEFLVGTCLLLAIWNWGAWLLCSLLCGCFVFVRASVLHRGLSVECGCGIIDEKITATSLALAIGLFAISIAANVAWVFQMRGGGKRSNSPIMTVHTSPVSSNATIGSAPMPMSITTAIVTMVMLTAALGLPRPARAAEPATLTIPELRSSGCKQLQEAFDRTLAAHTKDPAVGAITDRLANMDDVTAAVLHDLRIHHAAFLNQSLATVEGENSAAQEKSKLLGSAKIVEEFRPAFAKSAVPPGWTETDRATVEEYLQASSDVLAKFLQSRGHGCISVMGVDVPEVMRLSFVLPMLASDRDQSLIALQPPMPNWMARPADIRMQQQFAVQSFCPRVAFGLLDHGSATTAPADLIVSYIAFAKQEADAMSRTAKYQAALVCLRDGIAVANAAKRDADATNLSFRVAELLETVESADAAAQEMKHVQTTSTDASQYGRASMLRLKYLYASNHYDVVAAEAQADLKQPRCEAYLPQIMYIAWVACRRKDGADPEFWRKQFLQRFPDNPLGADMYFAAAMDQLSASNYDEASHLLQFIEYRFPQCKIIDKVREIQTRLAAGSVQAKAQTLDGSTAGSGK